MLQNIETLLINKNNIPAFTLKPSKMQQDKDTADRVLLYDKLGNSLKSGAKANSNTPLVNDYKKHISKLKMTVKFINAHVTKLF